MTRVTIVRVNAALAARGYAEILVKGNGYFYFAEGTASTWPVTSVMTAQLGSFSIEEWVKEREQLANPGNDMECPACSETIADTSIFCPNCGLELSSADGSELEEEDECEASQP